MGWPNHLYVVAALSFTVTWQADSTRAQQVPPPVVIEDVSQPRGNDGAADTPVVPDSLESPPAIVVPPTTPPRRRSTQSRGSDDLLASLLGDSRSRTRRSRNRLARTPEYFGDNFIGGDMIAQTGIAAVRLDLPLAAGSRRAKIADHNKAYPVDRVFVNYHHFHNAQTFTRPGVFDSDNIDRFTFGFEKTFDCGQASIEMRLPFADRVTRDDADFELRGGNVGNLAVILKRLMYESDRFALAYGLGVDIPTGSDVRGRTPLNGISFEVRTIPFTCFRMWVWSAILVTSFITVRYSSMSRSTVTM